MPKFVKLTLPAVSLLPVRPVVINIDHIASVSPRYKLDRRRAGQLTSDKDLPRIEKGTHIGMIHETEDFGTITVEEDFEYVVRMIQDD